MELFIALGNTSQAGYRRLYQRVREQDGSDFFHVFLTPDRFTLGVERDLIRFCFPDGYARADVVSFTRFATKTLGARAKNCLSKEGTVVLLRKVLRSSETKYYKNVYGYDFAKELFAAIASLRSAGLTIEEIEQKAKEKAITPILRDKLLDVALVERKYEEEMAGKYVDTVTRIDALDAKLQTVDLSKTHFYALGFSLYTEQQLRILKTLVRRGASLSLAVTAPIGGESCPGGQIGKFASDCREEGINVRWEPVEEPVNEGFDYLRQNLFLPRAKGRKKPTGLTIFREEGPYEEIAATAREINYLVRRDLFDGTDRLENYRYKDIAVVVDDKGYLPILRETFDRCGIPCFIDEGYPFSESLAAKFAFALLEGAEYKKESAFYKLARHPYLGLSTEDAEEFVRYCKKYGVRYNRFASPFSLGEYERAESVRRVVVDALSGIPDRGSPAAFGRALTERLTTERCDRVTEDYTDSADERIRAAAEREPLLRFIEEFGDLAGEEEMGCFEYLSTLRAALADKKIVLRPDTTDAVFVGSLEESRFDGVKAAFFLACTDENFPKKSGDGLIFSAVETVAMQEMEMRVFPSPIEKNALERFVLRDALSKFSDRLYFGCAETALDGTAQSPGDGLNEIAFLTGYTFSKKEAEEKDLLLVGRLEKEHRFSGKKGILYRSINEKNARYEYAAGAFSDDPAVQKSKKKEPDTAQYPIPFEKADDGYYKVSVSRLETYFACPYRYFLRYGVGVEEEEDSTLKANAIGTAIHGVLDRFFRKNAPLIDQKTDFSREIEEAIQQEFSQEQYKIYEYDALSSYFLEEVKKECRRTLPILAENMRHAKFRPIGFEVGFGFGKGDKLILLRADGATFKLVGKVDRVDENDGSVVIVDYKTGSVSAQFKDIYYGKKIQLYAYLRHYLDLGYRPAGTFYLPIGGGASSGGRSYAMVGQIKKDFEIYRALDDRVEGAVEEDANNFVSEAIDVKAEKTKARGWDISGRTRNALTEEEFLAVTTYVQALSEQALGEILSGYAEKKPLEEGECDKCAYRRFCGDVPARIRQRVDGVAPIVAAVTKREGAV